MIFQYYIIFTKIQFIIIYQISKDFVKLNGNKYHPNNKMINNIYKIINYINRYISLIKIQNTKILLLINNLHYNIIILNHL